MDLKLISLCLADVAMVVPGFVYGVKFLRKRNYLLGLEWLIMGTSGTNFFVYLLTGLHSSYNVAFFFDAFSRAIGFPVIVAAGLMVITHGYRPSTRADIGYFAAAIVVAVVLVGVDFVAPAKPYFYLVMNSAYSVYLIYFAWRLLRTAEVGHAIGVFMVMATGQVIASIYDFYHIPGDDEQHSIFYIIALLVWAYSLFELYYGYCALERAEKKSIGLRATSYA